MGMYDDVEGIIRRQMVMFFLVDASKSMVGTKIGSVNTAISQVIPELSDVGGADVDLKIACLIFANGFEWMHPSPVVAENFRWKTVQADGGTTDLGEACEELASKLSKNGFLSAPSASVAPVIFLMSDGQPTDDYESGIEKLKANNWFKYAIKVAVAIGDDADKEALTKFTGNREAVITVHKPEALKKWIRKVSVTSAQIGSKSQPVASGEMQSKQDSMIDEIQQIQQNEPDLDSASTDADAW